MTASPQNTSTLESYSEHVNPQWVRLLKLLQMQVDYTICSGAELHTAHGDVLLDFLSGYCVHNIGHNHPTVIDALHTELDRRGPAMLQSHVPDLAGDLAKRLCGLAGGQLEKAFFACSGSEGVEAAIKFSRGPMLANTAAIPFGDLEALQQKLRTKNYAAFFVEPVQSEAGIVVPPPDYLGQAKELCAKFGTLLVLDEVQTGMFRTGQFLAAHHFAVEPDMVILAKALSGGLVPVSAVLMTDRIYDSVYDSLKRSIVHTSTFGENSLAMRAGIATLDVLVKENLGPRALVVGEQLRLRLREALAGYEMVQEVRGLGMLSGIVFRPPKQLGLRLAFESFRRVHPAMFGQVLLMRMFRDQHVLMQMCGNNFLVLKVAPPLVIQPEQIDKFVRGIREVVHMAHHTTDFWTEAIGLATRAVNV